MPIRAWRSPSGASVEMHLTRLRYFVVTAEEGTVGGAARRLRIAQPALSRQLAALEREVGTPLFERHARGVRLLPAGAAFLAHAQRVLTEADSAVVAARSTQVEGAHLRLASPEVRAAWVARAIEQVHALRPAVQVDYKATLWLEHEAEVRSGTVDVGFAVAMSGGDFGEGVDADRVCDEPASVAILPATHALAARHSVTLADLRDETLLAPSRDRAPLLHDQSVALVRTGGYEPRLATAPPSFAAGAQLVAAGAGWIIAINSAADSLPVNVRAIPIEDASLVLGFYLLRRRSDRNEAADAFAECLHEVARSETASAG